MGFQWSSISSTPSLTRQASLLITRRINYNWLNSSLWEPIPHLKIIHHFLLFFNQAGKFSTSRRKLPDKRGMCFVIGWSGDSGWLDCSFMSDHNDVEQKLKRPLRKHSTSHQWGLQRITDNWAILKIFYTQHYLWHNFAPNKVLSNISLSRRNTVLQEYSFIY